MRTSLYRQYSKNGSLLYVGVSLIALKRIIQHSACSSWFEEISKVEIEHFETKALALEAERSAIILENPIYNKNKRKPERGQSLKKKSSLEKTRTKKNYMKKEITAVQTVRLPLSHWLKLRALMTHHGGRVWLEKAIDREAKKAGITAQAEKSTA